MGTKSSIFTSCAIPREALNHSSGFISNSASSELFADALSAAYEAESTVKLPVQIRFAAKAHIYRAGRKRRFQFPTGSPTGEKMRLLHL
jgi:hypothetical protein